MLKEFLGSVEDEILNHRPPPPPSVVLGVTAFLYGILAVGYAAFRLIVIFITWAASHHLLFGVGGVLALLCIGPCFVWLYMTRRRIFGGLELLASVSAAFYYSLKLSSTSYDLGVIVGLTGAVFLFVKGFRDVRPNRGA